MIGTATLELVVTATADAAQWVQIYGLLRRTDANDDLTILTFRLKGFEHHLKRRVLAMHNC